MRNDNRDERISHETYRPERPEVPLAARHFVAPSRESSKILGAVHRAREKWNARPIIAYNSVEQSLILRTQFCGERWHSRTTWVTTGGNGGGAGDLSVERRQSVSAPRVAGVAALRRQQGIVAARNVEPEATQAVRGKRQRSSRNLSLTLPS